METLKTLLLLSIGVLVGATCANIYWEQELKIKEVTTLANAHSPVIFASGYNWLGKTDDHYIIVKGENEYKVYHCQD